MEYATAYSRRVISTDGNRIHGKVEDQSKPGDMFKWYRVSCLDESVGEWLEICRTQSLSFAVSIIDSYLEARY